MRFALLLAFVCASSLSVVAAPIPKDAQPHVLVVIGEKTGKWQLYLVYPGSNEAKQISDNTVHEIDPEWSPDGKRIAFRCFRDECRNIWTMKPDGTDVQQVTKKQTRCEHHRWSPDGSRLAFVDRGQIHTIEVATGKVVQLTSSDSGWWGAHPEWSPDGKKLSYIHSKESDRFAYVMNSDGKDARRLSDNKDERNTAWSPDGTRIVFIARNPTDDCWKVYTIGADGKNQKLIAEDANPNYDARPQWSPDGAHIAFGIIENRAEQVAVMRTDGSKLKVITSKHRHFRVRWSSDGKSLSYSRDEGNGHGAVWVSAPDGENAKEVFRAGGLAEWKPK